jgi:hypothetical protein
MWKAETGPIALLNNFRCIEAGNLADGQKWPPSADDLSFVPGCTGNALT